MGRNIAELERSGHKPDQAIAIAYKEAGEDDGSPIDFTIDETAEAWISKKIEQLINKGYEQKQAEAIAYAEHRRNQKNDAADSARYEDGNGWAEIKGNPISKVGVFEYSGQQISPELEPDRIYNVYRPEEELNNAETIESFRLLPWTDEHEMLGNDADGLMPAEQKGVHGVIGEDVYFEDGYLKGNLKVFSNKLKSLIDAGKKELSIGYRCLYELAQGVYNGVKYDAIQREIRGNHIALVDEGRSGHDVAVLDHFKFSFDTKDLKMAEKPGDMEKPLDKKAADEGEEMGLKELIDIVKGLRDDVEAFKMKRADENDLEAEEINESENDIFDEEGEYNKFVNKADVTQDEEEPDKDAKKEEKAELSEKAAKEGDAKDEDETKPDGKGMDSRMKRVFKEIARRDSLADKLSHHIGTFDHKSKTLVEVARYGVSKLGLKCHRGHEESALAGYLAAAKRQTVAVAQDSRPKSSAIDAYIGGK